MAGVEPLGPSGSVAAALASSDQTAGCFVCSARGRSVTACAAVVVQSIRGYLAEQTLVAVAVLVEERKNRPDFPWEAEDWKTEVRP